MDDPFTHPLFPALRQAMFQTIGDHQIPSDVVMAVMVEGVAMVAAQLEINDGRRRITDADLDDFCQQVQARIPQILAVMLARKAERERLTTIAQ